MDNRRFFVRDEDGLSGIFIMFSLVPGNVVNDTYSSRKHIVWVHLE